MKKYTTNLSVRINKNNQVLFNAMVLKLEKIKYLSL